MRLPGLGPKTAARIWKELGDHDARRPEGGGGARAAARRSPGSARRARRRSSRRSRSRRRTRTTGAAAARRRAAGGAGRRRRAARASRGGARLRGGLGAAAQGDVPRPRRDRDRDRSGRADGVLRRAAVGRRDRGARRHEGDGRLERRPSLRPARRPAGVVRQPAAALHRLEGPQRRDARGRGAARAVDLRVRRHDRRDRRGLPHRGRGRAVRVPRLRSRSRRSCARTSASSRRRGAASCRSSSSSATCAATCTRTRTGRPTARTRSRRWSRRRVARGYEYYAITDHSHYLRDGRIARAARGDRGGAQAVSEAARSSPASRRTSARTARSTSPEEDLALLDWVVASVHQAPENRPTERVLEAMDNPYVDCIGHLTGRRIRTRGPRDVDVERVIGKALETGVLPRDQRPAGPARSVATCTRAPRRRRG